MNVRVLRRDGTVHEVQPGEGCPWLFEGRDFWAEESAPILVTGGSEEARSRFLAGDLAGAAQLAGSVVVVFSPEGPGGILDALGEALRALFPELGVHQPKGSELMQWALAVDRATKRSRVDLKRRLLIVDGFEAVWKGSSEQRASFVEMLRRVAGQRSMAVVVSVEEERLADCADLPGFGYAHRVDYLVPILSRMAGEEAAEGGWGRETRGERLEAGGRGARGFSIDWKVWAPMAGLVGVFLFLSHLFRPVALERPPLETGVQRGEVTEDEGEEKTGEGTGEARPATNERLNEAALKPGTWPG